MRRAVLDGCRGIGGITIDIILNEYRWAEKKLAEHDLGRKPSETIWRLAKYFLYIGLSKRETEKRIKQYMCECEPGIILIDWDAAIDRAIKSAKKNKLIILDHITITKTEMDKIDALRGRQMQRLAFTLLCVAKYRNAISDSPNMWVNTPDKDIMKMANINTSIKRQCAMFAELHDAGLIRFSKKVDNTSVEVLFSDDGDPALDIRDFRNLGYQYLMYHGEDYFVCEECGITEKLATPQGSRGRRKKYCPSCAAKIHMKQMVDSVMRRRELA